MNKNREHLQTKIADCLRDNGCSSDGAPNRYFAAGKVLDLIEQLLVAEQVQEKVDMQIDGVNYIVPKDMADDINRILQDALKNDGEKKFVLITEDQKCIYDTQQLVYGVDIETFDTADLIWKAYNAANPGENMPKIKWFSEPENLQEWLEYNKPCLSQKEVMTLVEDVLKTGGIQIPTTERYEETFKCRLDTFVMEKLSNNK